MKKIVIIEDVLDILGCNGCTIARYLKKIVQSVSSKYFGREWDRKLQNHWSSPTFKLVWQLGKLHTFPDLQFSEYPTRKYYMRLSLANKLHQCFFSETRQALIRSNGISSSGHYFRKSRFDLNFIRTQRLLGLLEYCF